MKLFFLTGSILFTVIILIIGFQNVGATLTDFNVFFTLVESNPALVIFGIFLLGVFAGGFYFGFLTSILKSDEDEPGGTIE